MATKNEVAMTIVDPGNRRWAQLVDLDWLVEDIVPLLVKRLELPDSLQYTLTEVDSGRKLPVQQTLASSGVSAGALLQLSPVRNKVLTDLLDALYEEAVGYVAKELWGQAEARLELIRRLDPNYPDPRGVGAALAARTAAPYAGGSAASTTAAAAASAAATSTAGASTYGATSPGQAAAATRTANRGLRGCLVATLVLVGLVAAVGFSAWRSVRNGIDLAGLPLIGGYFNDDSLPPFGMIDEPELGTGDVQVTLRWNNMADLDLHVVDPSGSEVWYDNPLVDSGGQLDVDANGTCSNDPPIENVFWTRGGAPDGPYDISVVYYNSCGLSEPTEYEVTIRVDGQVVDVRQGTLDESTGIQDVGSFER